MKDDDRLERWTEQGAGKRKKRKVETDKSGSESLKTKPKAEKEMAERRLDVGKPLDSASFQIFEWAKDPAQQDIQIDCCTT
jgi:hypothetical protein